MKKIYENKEKRKLKIGAFYDFFIIKTIILPNDKEYFVVQDPYGDRHLIPTEFYKDYNIESGKTYQFHVDKVNCKGQLFLEPKHPEYEPGEKYEFRYLKTVEELNKKGEKICYYLLEGKNGYLARTEGCYEQKPKRNVWEKYLVKKIKKAKVYLTKWSC